MKIVWFIVWFNCTEQPDFYINKVPFWMFKEQKFFFEIDEMHMEQYKDECKQFHYPEDAFIFMNDACYEDQASMMEDD